MYYHLEDYNKIIFDGISYTLSENILKTINILSEEISKIVPTATISTMNYSTGERYKKPSNPTNMNKKRMHHHKKNISDDEWNNLRNFKTTQLEKKEGIDKLINDVRSSLNKISTKNYENHRDNILELLKTINNELIQSENDEVNIKENELKKVANAIFEIASNNKFYSELYAELYKDLINTYSVFDEILCEFINNYRESVKEIKYVDQNTDYDKFCEYNKLNDRRKALSTFIVNLMNKNIINKTKVIGIISYFQEIIFEYIETVNKTNEVEEIGENLYILITTSKNYCNDIENWNEIIENVKKISEMKTKDKKSLSSRAKFKFMDILDDLKK